MFGTSLPYSMLVKQGRVERREMMEQTSSSCSVVGSIREYIQSFSRGAKVRSTQDTRSCSNLETEKSIRARGCSHKTNDSESKRFLHKNWATTLLIDVWPGQSSYEWIRQWCCWFLTVKKRIMLDKMIMGSKSGDSSSG